MKKILGLVAFLALLGLVLAYVMGVFHGDLVEPGQAEAAPGLPAPTKTVVAERAEAPVVEEAVGTVASERKVAVSAQVQARVKEVHADAGESVEAGKPLIVLDDRELVARRSQAADGLRQAEAAKERAIQARAQAEAVLGQAQNHFKRIKGLFDASAATPDQLERAESARLQATAAVAEADAAIAAAAAQIEQAREGVTGADVALSHARIAVPITGVVSMKDIEPGDSAWPGKTLLEIIDPTDLRLEAQVREGLISTIVRGMEYEVEIPAAGRTVMGTVGEICPTANPLSRTFGVRITFDPVPGVHPGMFGRLRLPVGAREVVRVPAAAIVRVGQLETVLVKTGDVWARRLVTTGLKLEDGAYVEVLSGLEGGETVGLPERE